MIRNFRTYDLAIRFYRLCLRQPLVHPEKDLPQRRRANGSGQVIGSPLPDCRFLEWLTSPWDLFLEGYSSESLAHLRYGLAIALCSLS